MTTTENTTARSMSDYAIIKAEELLVSRGLPNTDEAFDAALEEVLNG